MVSAVPAAQLHPVDFDLFGHESEWEIALTHLNHATLGDVIVRDRGYFSLPMALAHRKRGNAGLGRPFPASPLPPLNGDPVPALSDLCHGRWGIEEMCKTGKTVTEDIRAESERGICQEFYAAFVLITVRANAPAGATVTSVATARQPCANFRNGLCLIGREIEAMFLLQSQMIAQSVGRTMGGLSRCVQRERPGRSHRRESRQPRSK